MRYCGRVQICYFYTNYIKFTKLDISPEKGYFKINTYENTIKIPVTNRKRLI